MTQLIGRTAGSLFEIPVVQFRALTGIAMLTFIGLIGKAVEMVVSKVAEKHIDFALDEKKTAARAFVRFHQSVVQLTDVLDAFLDYTQTFLQGRNFNLRDSRISAIAAKVQPASEEFLRSLTQLGPVLEIYDPALSVLLCRGWTLKVRLLKNVYAFFEESVNPESNGGRIRRALNAQQEMTEAVQPPFRYTPIGDYFCSLDVALPNDSLMKTDWTPWYESAEESLKSLAVDEFRDLPSFSDVVHSNLETMHIGHDDLEKLRILDQKLKQHRQLLGDAVEGLRKFIEANFSIADVLSIMRTGF